MDIVLNGIVKTVDIIVHLKHYKDEYPICWPMTKSGAFKGSFRESEVTCPECIAFIKEYCA